LSLDPKIVEALRTATSEAGQPPALARRLVAWLEAVADGNEDINDIAATDRRLEIAYEAVAAHDGDVEGDDADESDNGEVD
jgi:hypothetical protein